MVRLRAWRVIPFATILFASAAAAADPVVMDDFEKGKPDGWMGYKDADSERPGFVIVRDEAISGEGALKVTFHGCKTYQGLQFYKAPALPEKAVGVSFLMKPVSGAPPSHLALSERRERYGNDLKTGTGRIALNGGDWQKVTIRFDEMVHGSGPERGKPFPLNPGAIYSVRFYMPVTDQPSVVLLDDLVWELE